ncbi:MAG: 2-oxoglutarate dehydrogenase E1 component [Polyangiales bacterium]
MKDFGINAGLVSEMVGLYLHDRASVDETWRAYLDGLISGGMFPTRRAESPAGNGAAPATNGNGAAKAKTVAAATAQNGVTLLIAAYRARGHLLAQIDPLGLLEQDAPAPLVDFQLGTFGLNESDLDAEFSTDIPGYERATLRAIVERLRATYCRSIGCEFRDIEEPEQRAFLQRRMESTGNRLALSKELQRRILLKLTQAEVFETFLHRNFQGAKRFSAQGAESMIPMLDLLIDHAAEHGAEEIVLGMAHRGRLNVLVNIVDKDERELFAQFRDKDPEKNLGSGDVKYHLGSSTDRTTLSGKKVHLTLAFNPSHLEWVNPVVEGRVRAKLDRKKDFTSRRTVVPLLIHGDAAFIGQGVNAETLNLARLDGYHTGGTIHVLVNNQIGFTTIPKDDRSTRYATDLARMLRVPVFHVNGEDLEAVAHVAQMAAEYRQKFGADVVIDLYCYRKYGHNEGDEPRFTQPTMYAAIDKKQTIRDIFVKEATVSGGLQASEVEACLAECNKHLSDQLEDVTKNDIDWAPHAMGGVWTPYRGGRDIDTPEVPTGVDGAQLIELARRMVQLPEGFQANPKVHAVVQQRLKALETGEAFDWGAGEACAFASILASGTSIRLAGQDARRGTFTHRHSVLFDAHTGARHTPLTQLGEGQGRFEVYDSPLSEAGVLGFEYGYSLDYPDSLVIWEAQFGDFANTAQVILDQFISSAEDKWRRLSGLVLLLPHGYEGQGPEHSNARLGRFLSMCAEDNWQICNLTTPAQLFHVLRRQVLRPWRKPLIIMSPKSLLRFASGASRPKEFPGSTLADLTQGKFQRIIGDTQGIEGKKARKLLLCSGKVYYDLAAHRAKKGANDVAIARLEQLYPIDGALEALLAKYENGTQVAWVQEEPWNEGGWYFVSARLGDRLRDRFKLSVVARDESASPATGSKASHDLEQARLLEQAFA